MGICTSAGIIRDFAGPYFVSVRYVTYVCGAQFESVDDEIF